MDLQLLRILALLYFMLPAYIANAVPPLFSRMRTFSYPLDCNLTIKGKRLLGAHKTWRGLILGTGLGTATFYLQQQWTPQGSALAIFNYSEQSLILGFLLAFGALAGDAVKSFAKRRQGIAPGKPWYLFDQIDYLIGSLILAGIIYTPDIKSIGVIVTASFLLTIAVKHIGYYLGVNKTPW